MKRLFDLVGAIFVAIVCLPIFIILTAIGFLAFSGRPFFVQRRPGHLGKIFNLLKFKTMVDACDADGKPLPDEKRFTAWGKILRASSLDELPQIFNVLKGEMSLVGPRPLLPEYLEVYTKEELKRHQVRPGITGWAQVNGRNATQWDERLAADLWYVRNQNFLLDLKILGMTFLKVIRRDGIMSSENVTIRPLHEIRKSLIVIGAGGHAKVVIATAQAAGFYVEAAYDDDASKWGKEILGVPVKGPIDFLKGLHPANAVIAVGSNGVRRQLAEQFDLNWIRIVHPSALVHDSVKVGRGSVVFAGVVLQPGTKLGEHVIVNTAAIVDHDCMIQDFVHLAPGVKLAGGVRVGESALVGVGACVRPLISVGAHATVGAGAAVVAEVRDEETRVGVPAKPVRAVQ